MAHTVRIEPTGHSFTALPEETLLEAALRSGININYNCSNGSCGDCKAQLLSGDIESIPADYRFSPQEKREGYILLCSSRASSDLVIAAQEAHSPRDIPRQQITTKVVKVEERGKAVRLLHLRTPRTRTLRFLAGQHARLTLADGETIDAPVASCPCNGMQLQFHFRRSDESPFIERLFTTLRSGETIELEGPFGDVTLDDDSRRPLLMVAVDEAFAPIKSLIEHAINLDIREPVRLFWLANKSSGHYLENHCRSWYEVLDDYRFIPLDSAGDEPGPAEVKRLLEAIRTEVPNPGDFDIYVAGPPSFQQLLCKQLLASGAEGGRVFMPQRRILERVAQEA
jgi:CDP-4-dehydro-6-deoxyglucose reductase